MLIFLVFRATIGIVHSDDSFRIGVCKLNSTTESSLWAIYFIVATSFYNAPRNFIIFKVKNMKIAVAGTGYVGLSIAVLLA